VSDDWVSAQEADQLLTDYADLSGIRAVRGKPLSGRRYKRWRSAGVMPPRERRGAGRGSGVLVRDPPDAKFQLAWLCGQLERSRTFWQATLFLWYGQLYTPEGRIRELVLGVFRAHENLRPSDDPDDIADKAYEGAQLSMRPYSGAERQEAERLAAGWRPPTVKPESRLTSREVLTHARTQLNEATLGADPTGFDAELLTSLHRFDEFDRLDGSDEGYSATNVTPRMLKAIGAARVIEVVTAMTEDDFAHVRWYLHQWWQKIRAMRNPGMPAEYQAWANQVGLEYDPREPGYNPFELLVVLGVTAANLVEFQPEFLTLSR